MFSVIFTIGQWLGIVCTAIFGKLQIVASTAIGGASRLHCHVIQLVTNGNAAIAIMFNDIIMKTLMRNGVSFMESADFEHKHKNDNCQYYKENHNRDGDDDA